MLLYRAWQQHSACHGTEHLQHCIIYPAAFMYMHACCREQFTHVATTLSKHSYGQFRHVNITSYLTAVLCRPTDVPANGLSQQVMHQGQGSNLCPVVLQGEGETKILRRINSSPQGSHVIVGNDSDIILMSMMCPVKQLYILAQHTQGKSSRFNCISLDALDLPEQGTAEESGAAHALVCVSCAVLCCAMRCCAAL